MPGTPIAVIASAQANAAAAAAHAARVTACRAVIDGYDSKQATVEQAQAYAGCVETVYPQPMPQQVSVGLAMLVLASVSGGVVFAWREGDGGIVDAFMNCIVGAIITGAALGAIGLVLWALATVLS